MTYTPMPCFVREGGYRNEITILDIIMYWI